MMPIPEANWKYATQPQQHWKAHQDVHNISMTQTTSCMGGATPPSSNQWSFTHRQLLLRPECASHSTWVLDLINLAGDTPTTIHVTSTDQKATPKSRQQSLHPHTDCMAHPQINWLLWCEQLVDLLRQLTVTNFTFSRPQNFFYRYGLFGHAPYYLLTLRPVLAHH